MRSPALSMTLLTSTMISLSCSSFTVHKKDQCASTEEELLQEYYEKYEERYRDIGYQWSKWAYIIRRCELRGQKCECKYGRRQKKITENEYDAEFQKRYGEPFRYGVQREQFGRMKADIEFENKCGCHGK